MDRLSTLDTLTAMFQHVPDAAQHFDVALTRATVMDINGVAPSSIGWVETFDEWFAAAEVAELLGLFGAMSPGQVLSQFESEGSKFVYAGAAVADWASVARGLRARSPLMPGGVIMVDVGSPAEPFHPRSSVTQW